MNPRIAYLAPEIPSVSATFVYREMAAVERQGVTVVPFTMRRVPSTAVSRDGLPWQDRVEVLYDEKLRLVGGALAFALRHPWRALRTLGRALADTASGTFARPRARWKVPAQALAGLHLARRLRRRGVAHLHVHFANAPATIGMYAAQAAGLPFSITAHANDLYVEASLLREKIERAAPFCTISNANRAALEASLPGLQGTVALVRCGVDLARFPPRERRRAVPARVVTVGRLVPKKGFDVLLRAVSELVRFWPEIHVEVLGDGPEREALEQEASALGIAQRVRFHGAVDADTVQAALATAACFALPSRLDPDGDRDGIPVALMEAMATAVPVVSTRVSGIPELIEHGRTGLLATPGRAADLAACLHKSLGDAEGAHVLALAGRDTVLEAFDQDRNAGRLLDLIHVRHAMRPDAVRMPVPSLALGAVR